MMFLRYRFGREGLTLAAKTIEQFVARAEPTLAQRPGTLTRNKTRSPCRPDHWGTWHCA
jgi:hypothetical protein